MLLYWGNRTTYCRHLLDLNPLDSAVLGLNFALDVFGKVQIPVPLGFFFGIKHVMNNDSRSRVHRWYLGPNSQASTLDSSKRISVHLLRTVNLGGGQRQVDIGLGPGELKHELLPLVGVKSGAIVATIFDQVWCLVSTAFLNSLDLDETSCEVKSSHRIKGHLCRLDIFELDVSCTLPQSALNRTSARP